MSAQAKFLGTINKIRKQPGSAAVLFFSLLIAFGACLNCAREGPHRPVKSQTPEGRASESPDAVTYDQVRPIFATHCAACHPTRSGPNWLDYAQARVYVQNGKLLRRAVRERTMPPPGSAQAAAISDRERQMISKWIEAGGPPAKAIPQAAPTPANIPGAPSAIPEVVEQCLHCHGTEGPTSSASKIPFIAGQNEEYLATQLERFKWRARVSPMAEMNDLVAGLSEQEIKLVANFFAARAGILAERERPETPGESALFRAGKERASVTCVTCHMNPDTGRNPISAAIPKLKGQSEAYIINQLIFYREDERLSPQMHEQAAGLSNRDIEALAFYFSHL